ncbi:MAG TPA: DUF2272 domain-containing protein [Gammaproteobacteria bacterium]
MEHLRSVARVSLIRLLAVLAGLAAVAAGHAQEAPVFLQRLPLERLDAPPPASRVRGEPGAFAVEGAVCRAEPPADVRRRIVDLVVQEWAFFGFAVMDETDPATWARRPRPFTEAERARAERERQRELEATLRDPASRAQALRQLQEAARVAPSIAGYWAATPDGGWIVERYNAAWRASGGLVTRWRDPWSAAFISWVMCEAGFASPAQFQRAIAHHTYIDQAIRARDGRAPDAVYVAHEPGEAEVVPGDMLCLARRPAYRTLAERREHMGVGARTHCDVVVKVDEERQRFLAIGGNVRGTVGLKLLPAERQSNGPLRPVDRAAVVPGAATTFAHLKLRAAPIEPNALDTSATMAALACARGGWEPPTHLRTVGLLDAAQTSACEATPAATAGVGGRTALE